jgi:segregation and condensation protein B
MNEDLRNIIEATLLAAGRPVTVTQLCELFDERERPAPEQMVEALQSLAEQYSDRGLEVIEVASGWRIQIRARYVDVVSRLWQERPARYSRALLETLALIAYRQPITRSEIEEIRGVSISSTIMRTLQERNWIRTVGHREVPGRPELLGTTREFLDYFGLKSLEDLPTLAELKDVETIGVQLELGAGDPQVESADQAADPTAELTESTDSDALNANVTADTTDADAQALEAAHTAETEQSATEQDEEVDEPDALDNEDDDAEEGEGDGSNERNPTLVAGEQDDGAPMREPPSEAT